MSRYLARTCPKCKNYFAVVIPVPLDGSKEVPINANCLKCGFKLAWKMVQGKRQTYSLALRIVALAVFFLFLISSLAVSQQTGSQHRTIKRVVDGDTLVLENGERVRLIGVDTPETKHPNKPVQRFGKEATAFTQKMVQGKSVRVEFEQGYAPTGHKDKYGRTLAYVFLEDGTFLNAEIVKQGYGHAYTRFPFRYLKEFRQLEREAREQGKGLWAKGD